MPFGASGSTSSSRLLTLHPTDAASTGMLRVLSPPDEIREVPVALRACGARRWARSLDVVHPRVPDDDPPETALRALVEPLAYQWVPLLALRSGRTRRLLLADEVGMGKTVQAGFVLAELHDRMATARSLTVVPASLVGQWRDELERRFSLTATVLDSEVLAAHTSSLEGEPAAAGDACLISMDTLRQPEVAALMERCAWHLLVVDEAHLLVPGSARHDATSRIARRAGRVLLCTATPFSGVERQDRHLLAVGRRPGGEAGDRMLVVCRRASALGRTAVTQRVAWVHLSEDERHLHAQLDAYVARAMHDTADDAAGRLAAYLLRRRACSSMPAFTTSLRRRLDVLGSTVRGDDTLAQPLLPLGDEHEATDDVLRAPAWLDLEAERACLTAIRTTAEACRGAGAKASWLARWIARCREPVLVFTEYADTLRALRPLLSPAHRVVCLYGAQTTDQRQLAVHQFCSGEADVLLATDAAAEGLNLHQRCRVVVHVDVPWSPRRLTQRNGRLDRLGQTRSVHATLLAGRGTFDLAVLNRLTERRRLVQTAHASAHADVAMIASRRRDRVAQECLRRCGPREPTHRQVAGEMLRTRVSARRWKQLAQRLGLPTGCRALVFAQMGLAGVHPLVRGRVWVTAAARREMPLRGTGIGVSAWPALTRFVRRARRRAARLDALEAAARASTPAAPPPDLFGVHPSQASETPREDERVSPTLHVLAMRVLSWRR
jgi:superfamily II DNA or RNA helicase